MIKYKKGDLLEANAEALVNTVNTQGVMGKGIALQFKERFPVNFKLYANACKTGSIGVGKLYVVKEQTLEGLKIIINFPTKTEWFKKSQYSYIEEGLKDLLRIIHLENIQSIALPPLGCGNGGLKWEKVKPLMEKYLSSIPIDVIIFEPNEAIKEVLQKENLKKEVGLTPARAMLLYALMEYEKRGENPSVFAANKLAYFLQESGEPLRLEFVPYTYGPYAQAVEKVLYALNGKYITGLEQMKAKAFEPIQINYDKSKEILDFINTKVTFEQKVRLDNLFRLISGFESSLSLEILSSIHFLSKKQKMSVEELLGKIQSWNDRKKNLIQENHISIALKHLEEYSNNLNFN